MSSSRGTTLNYSIKHNRLQSGRSNYKANRTSISKPLGSFRFVTFVFLQLWFSQHA